MSENVAQPDDDAADPPARAGSISRDELFEVLGNERRRHAVEVILDHGGTLDVSSLVDRVAAIENDKLEDDLTSAERKRVYTALRQTHLPMIEEFGLIAWDRESDEIEPAETLTNVNVYLGVVSRRRVPFSVVYFALVLVGSGLLAADWLSLGPLARIPASVLAGAVVGTFGITAVIYLYRIRQTKLDPESFIPGGSVGDLAERRDPGAEIPSLSLSVSAGLLAGLVGGLSMGAIFHFDMFMMPLVGSIYGRPFVMWGWVFHVGHSLLFALAFCLAVSRTRLRVVGNTVTGATVLGAFYGLVLWVVVEGMVLPAVSNASIRTITAVGGYDVLYLPMDGLAAHVVYGLLLGAVYVAGLRFLSR